MGGLIEAASFFELYMASAVISSVANKTKMAIVRRMPASAVGRAKEGREGHAT